MAIAVSFVGVLVAAIASMVLGMLWYSPAVFGKKWMELTGLKEKDIKKQHMTASYAIAFVTSLITAYVLGFVVQVGAIAGVGSGVTGGMAAGFMSWLGFVAPVMAGMVLWEGKPKELYFLNAGHQFVNLVVMGAVLAFVG